MLAMTCKRRGSAAAAAPYYSAPRAARPAERAPATRRRAGGSRSQHGDLLDRHRASRGSPGSCARSSRRATSAPPARSRRSRSRSRSRTSSAACSPTRRCSAAFVPVFTELLEQAQAQGGVPARRRAVRPDPRRARRDHGRSSSCSRRRDHAAVHRRRVHAAARRPDRRPRRRCCSRSCCCSGSTGCVVGILNAYDHFTIPAIAPLVWNVVIIVALVVLHAALPRPRPALRLRDRRPRSARSCSC